MRYYVSMDNEKTRSTHAIRDLMNRDFVLGFFTFFAYMFAFFTLVPTLPIYLVRLGSSMKEIGILVGIFSISSLASRLFAGKALSRYSEKTVMLSAALLFAVTFFACIVLRPFWPFLAVRLFQGVAYACLDTAVFALIVKVTKPSYLGRALGYLTLAPGLATVMAPSFGMFFVNRFGFTNLFLFCIGVSLCALLFSSLLKGPKMAKPDTGVPTGSTFFLERKIIVPATSALFYYFTSGAVMAFFSLYAIQCGIKNPGYFFSACALMAVAGRALGGKILDSWKKENVILVFTATSMVAMVMLSFSKTLPMFIFVGLLWGVGVAFILPASIAYAFDYAGLSGGTAVGTFRALTDLGFAVGPMVMGLIVPRAGYQVMFLCLGLISLINLAYFQFYVRRKYHARPTV